MATYRCTRNLSPAPIEDRQGYYVDAQTLSEAMETMAERFPRDKFGFSCEIWNGDESIATQDVDLALKKQRDIEDQESRRKRLIE